MIFFENFLLNLMMIKLTLMTLAASAFCCFAHEEGENHLPALGDDKASVITGNGVFTYKTIPGWGELPEGKNIGPTHGAIVLDKKGNIYVTTDAEHSICVFDASGKFLKSIAPDCSGLHSLSIVEEDGKEYLYGAHLTGKRIVKLDLDGNVVMSLSEENVPGLEGGFNGVTSVAISPKGHLFAFFGYGNNMVRQFDKSGKLIKSFGGLGKGAGSFVTCHGSAIDFRYEEPRILVCDRGNRRLVHLNLDGDFIQEYAVNLRRPCQVSFWGDYCAAAELEGRVSIMDKEGTVVALLGDNHDKKQHANFKVTPEEMRVGYFTAPHGLSFDKEGNLFVQEWNKTGRLTKLERVFK